MIPLSSRPKGHAALPPARDHPSLLALAGTPFWKLVVKQFDDLLVKVCALIQVNGVLHAAAHEDLWRMLRRASSAPMLIQADREPSGPELCCAYDMTQHGRLPADFDRCSSCGLWHCSHQWRAGGQVRLTVRVLDIQASKRGCIVLPVLQYHQTLGSLHTNCSASITSSSVEQPAA